MSNKNYQRSRAREYLVLNLKKKEGKFAIRTAGSHSPADVVAISPAVCGNANHYEVEFIQIKVSQNLRNPSSTYKVEEIPFPANIHYMSFPVKDKQWHEKTRIKKEKSIKKVSSNRRVLRKSTTNAPAVNKVRGRNLRGGRKQSK